MSKTKKLDELGGAETEFKHEPELDFHPEISPQDNPIEEPSDHFIDDEGAMAKADLFKLAKYSVKLFQKLDDNEQLEAWVQAKITKAADYIASVYHYLEYEMKFSEYGKKLDDAETYTESQKIELKNKLMEAKEKIKELKKLDAEKISGRKKEECMKETSEEKKKAYRDAAGKDMQKAAKEGDKARVSKRLRGVSASLKESPKPDYIDLDDDGDTKEPMKKAAKEKSCKVKESAKPDYIDLDKDGDKKEPMKKAAKEKKLNELSKETLKSYADKRGDQYFTQKKPAGFKELDKYDLGLKKLKKKEKEDAVKETAPSAGLSSKQKSATVKKAKAGGDIGKKGKGFEKVASKAAEKYGSKEKGEKVAAAAMWKNIKREGVNESVSDNGVNEFFGDNELVANSPQLQQLLAMRKKYPEGSDEARQLDARIKFLQDRLSSEQGDVMGPGGTPKPVLDPAAFKQQNPNFKYEESMNESTDLARIKELNKRLLG